MTIPPPTCGLRILNNRDDRWWSSTVAAVASASRPGPEFYQSIELHGDTWNGGGSLDLIHWPSPYMVGVLPVDWPIIDVRGGVTAPAHGQSVLQSVLFRRVSHFSEPKNSLHHWMHIDDLIAILGGGAPYAKSWDVGRIEHLRKVLAETMTNVSVVTGTPWTNARSGV